MTRASEPLTDEQLAEIMAHADKRGSSYQAVNATLHALVSTIRQERTEHTAQAERVRELELALRNVKALAKRLRKRVEWAENADHFLRFCEQGGCGDSDYDILCEETEGTPG